MKPVHEEFEQYFQPDPYNGITEKAVIGLFQFFCEDLTLDGIDEDGNFYATKETLYAESKIFLEAVCTWARDEYKLSCTEYFTIRKEILKIMEMVEQLYEDARKGPL
jgi:hypothetical protein